jgi:hypothetical protein
MLKKCMKMLRLIKKSAYVIYECPLERAKIWVHLMGRGNFTIRHVTRQTYVCSDHFDENVVLDYRLVSIYFINLYLFPKWEELRRKSSEKERKKYCV